MTDQRSAIDVGSIILALPANHALEIRSPGPLLVGGYGFEPQTLSV